MTFVFWQNIIAIHQKALLTELSKNHEVILVAEQEHYHFRLQQGWKVPDMGAVSIFIAPDDVQMQTLMKKHAEAVHIFSGFQTYKLSYRAFRHALKMNYKTLVYSEPFDLRGLTGLLRSIKLRKFRVMYADRIDGILATGNLGIECFKNAGFDDSKIFDFGYFTGTERDFVAPDSSSIKDHQNDYAKKPDLLFVGSINHRKNIINLVRSLKKMQHLFNSFEICGGGELEPQLLKEIDECKSIRFLGTIDNDKVKMLMKKRDILILPSRFDGWGAVVNEALENGMRVLASEKCGSSVLLDKKFRGEAFALSTDEMEKVLEKWLQKGRHSPEERLQIIEWSIKCISGKAASEYLTDVCDYIYNIKKTRPIVPWLQNKG